MAGDGPRAIRYWAMIFRQSTRVFGVDGMGEVYKARNTRLDSLVNTSARQVPTESYRSLHTRLTASACAGGRPIRVIRLIRILA